MSGSLFLSQHYLFQKKKCTITNVIVIIIRIKELSLGLIMSKFKFLQICINYVLFQFLRNNFPIFRGGPFLGLRSCLYQGQKGRVYSFDHLNGLFLASSICQVPCCFSKHTKKFKAPQQELGLVVEFQSLVGIPIVTEGL